MRIINQLLLFLLSLTGILFVNLMDEGRGNFIDKNFSIVVNILLGIISIIREKVIYLLLVWFDFFIYRSLKKDIWFDFFIYRSFRKKTHDSRKKKKDTIKINLYFCDPCFYRLNLLIRIFRYLHRTHSSFATILQNFTHISP